ncbi:MAG: adenylate/guanylate cyclase domain-containing protein, partial [Saprospiraceae bacterium]
SRQLAAIMFTDIVGYTELMGQDEQKAFDFLNKNRAIQKPIIEQYQGRWIKELGDGVMASFFSVSDAATAAIKIQEACNEANEFRLRIGIHVGEVVFENDDVFGDGVNIAARIQAQATIGCIWISEAVQHNLVNKNDITTSFVKTIELKNVKEPVKIYQINLKGQEPLASYDVVESSKEKKLVLKQTDNRRMLFIAAIVLLLLGSYFLNKKFNPSGSAKTLSDPLDKSIAVLPFTDMSPGKDQEHLGDGLAEGIISKLSEIQDFKVIGRTSSFQFKGEKVDLRNIGEKLNVGTILEGSVQKSNNKIRITAQLINVKENIHLWSQQYDREMNDLFKIQDEISSRIADLLKISLSGSRNQSKAEISPESYNIYLKGLYAYRERKYEQSIAYNLQAIKTDPANAFAYAYIALAKAWIIFQNNNVRDSSALNDAQHYAYESIKLNPGLAEGYSALALMAWQIELDFKKAKENFEKSILYDPNASLIGNRYAYFLVWMGDFDKAVTLAKKAMQSDPVDNNGYVILSWVYLYTGKIKEANEIILEGIRLFPDNKIFHSLQIQKEYRAGSYPEVINKCNTLLNGNGTLNDPELAFLSIAYYKTGQPIKSDEYLNLLQKRGSENKGSGYYFSAVVYAERHQIDSCFSNLNKSFDHLEPALKFLKIDPAFSSLKNNPAYQRLYKLYGFDRY